MNIGAAIKRLQHLEMSLGPEFPLVTLQTSDGEIYIEEGELVIDSVAHEDKQVVAVMPKAHWEEIAPKGIQYDSV